MTTATATAAARPQAHGPTFLGAQRWTATLAVACAFIGGAASGDLGFAAIALFVAGFFGGPWFSAHFAHRYTLIWNTLLVAALLLLAGQVVTGQADIVLAAARFVVMLLVHRLCNRANQRDEVVLLLLSLLLLCGGAALSAELVFGLAFAAYAVSATWALVLLHLRGEIESGRSRETSEALLASRKLATPRLLAALAVLALAGLVGSALIFFTFPRVTIGGFHRAAGRSIAGLSDRIELGGQGAVSDDPRVVLRARIEGAKPADLDLHWRARTLELWTGRGWRSRARPPAPVTSWPKRPSKDEPQWMRTNIEAVGGSMDGTIVTPDGWPMWVSFPRPFTARPSQGPKLLRDDTGDLFYSPPGAGDLTYDVMVDRRRPQAFALRGRGTDYPKQVAIDLMVPRLDPRVRQLSERLTRGLDPADAASAVERWLSSNLRYTRQLADGGDDPIANFLFERREGHCELFASAMVLLLRAAHIPARAVTGYYGGKWTNAGYHALRAGDAHSWVEVYFPGEGFVQFDPTPAGERGSQENGLWAKLVIFWDTVAARWRVNVVDFDLVQQGRLLRSIAGALQGAAKRFSRPSLGEKRTFPWRAAGGGAAAIAIALLVRWQLKRRRVRRGLTLRPDERRAALLWQGARARLSRAGLPLEPGATPREAVRRASQLGAPVQAATTRLVGRYLQARWGGAPLPQSEARELLRALEQSL